MNRASRLQGRWDRRDVTELSQTNFRTTMRGFDREEVRAVLDSVAADYRVLQLQNASLQRQLTHLDAVLQDYEREHNDDKGLAITHALQRAKDEARAALVRANQQAEETMARIAAYAREAECRVAQLEEDRRSFQTLLVSTISEMITILGRYQYPMDPLVLEMPALPPPVEEPKMRALAASVENIASTLSEPKRLEPPRVEPDRIEPVRVQAAPVVPEPVENDRADEQQQDEHEDEAAAPAHSAPPPAALTPVAMVDRDTTRRTDDTVRSRSSFMNLWKHESNSGRDAMQSILRDLDRALVQIPALACE
jgi:DivIVA domain-containing protein